MIEQKHNHSPMTWVSQKSATFANVAALLSKLIKMRHLKFQPFFFFPTPSRARKRYVLNDSWFPIFVLKIDFFSLPVVRNQVRYSKTSEWFLMFWVKREQSVLTGVSESCTFTVFGGLWKYSKSHNRGQESCYTAIFPAVGNIIRQ